MSNIDEHIIIRNKIIELSVEFSLQSNSNNIENRKILKPYLEELENWYIHNRPINEITMTKQSWKSIWYDDADISNRGPIRLNKNKIWQIIGDNSYYNISENSFGGCFKFTNYLQGSFNISNRDNKSSIQKRLNTIDLKFIYNGIGPNILYKDANLTKIVENVEKTNCCFHKNAISIPGPIGVKGQLWNLYLDDTYRFSYGINLNDPSTIDIYILERNNIIV
jgi:hypothetical protein